MQAGFAKEKEHDFVEVCIFRCKVLSVICHMVNKSIGFAVANRHDGYQSESYANCSIESTQ